ncbi:class I tRNA ligase family protein, partial [Candidatus Dependentiae bacterium]
LYEVGFGILQLYAPFASFVTENIFQELFKNSEKNNSLHLTIFNIGRYSSHVYAQDAEEIDAICSILAQVRKMKSEKALSLKTPVQKLEICATDMSLLGKIQKHEKLLCGVTQAESVTYGGGPCRIPGFEKTEGENITIRAGIKSEEI